MIEFEGRAPGNPIGIVFDDRGALVACATGALVERIARLGEPVGPILRFEACCRSSVVEHSLGKGEVDSSILSGSTRYLHKSPCIY